jgi:predicted metal-binding membrane protein
MNRNNALEALLKRERAVVLAGLAGVTGLAWVYLFVTAAEMGAMAAMGIRPWTGLDFLLMFLMWAVMMIAMMLPGAAPMILLFAALRRKQGARERGLAPVGAFVAGYVAVWSAFSLGATLLQWGLERAALLSPMMAGTGPLLGGALLVAAGLYQWTPPRCWWRPVSISGLRSSRPACVTAVRRSTSSSSAGARAGVGPSSWAWSTAPSALAAAGS